MTFSSLTTALLGSHFHNGTLVIVNIFVTLLQHYAARAGRLPVCKLLLSNGADVNARLNSGDTALHRASYMGHDKVVQMLLEFGAEALQGADGQTPLHKVRCSLSIISITIIFCFIVGMEGFTHEHQISL